MFAIGLLASWLGTVCWNEASQRLAPSLAGQLIVFETLAALSYALMLRGTLPAWPTWAGVALLVAGGLLALLPPVWEIPLAAYLSVACLLLGGITALPAAVGWVLDGVAPWVARRALPLLAVERARRVRESAAVAVSGVVASLSLAVALTVMVASFRTSVTDWLDAVLPAALYVRTATSGSAADTAYFDPAFVQGAAQLPGVERLSTQRTLSLTLDPAQPAIALLVRPLRDAQTGALNLPLVGNPVPVPAGWVSM